VFAANDLMGLGAEQALAARGLDVPANVAVVGFDDLEPSSARRR
jgi:LacI family transcriptional regulator